MSTYNRLACLFAQRFFVLQGLSYLVIFGPTMHITYNTYRSALFFLFHNALCPFPSFQRAFRVAYIWSLSHNRFAFFSASRYGLFGFSSKARIPIIIGPFHELDIIKSVSVLCFSNGFVFGFLLCKALDHSVWDLRSAIK